MGSVAAQEPWRSPTTAVADVHQVHCLDSLPSSAPVATCAQLAASAALHPGTEQRIVEAPTRASGGAGKGALIGLGLGLGVGGMAAFVFGGECEEGHAGCTAGLIVGGAALGAGVGAILGAVSD
jgi:hypothetical protein